MPDDSGGSLPERMRRAAQRAGLTSDDPLMALIETMAEAASAARLLSPEAEAALIERLGRSAAVSIEAASHERTRAVDLATSLLGGGVLALALGIGLAGGWVLGQRQPVMTEYGPMTRPAAEVLAANDLGAAVAACTGTAVWRDRATGRAACNVRLWLERAPVPGR